MSRRLLTNPAWSMTLAGIAALWLLSDFHWGVARLVCMLAFFLVGPGGAAVALTLREIDDAATEAVIIVAVSVSLDIGVAQGMVWFGAWKPEVGVYCLAAVTMLMGAVAGLRNLRERASTPPLTRPRG